MHLLTLNTGSSSLKATLYDAERTIAAEVLVTIERIGGPGSFIRITDAHGATLLDRHEDLPDHDRALRALFAWLKRDGAGPRIDAVGHRVVHGGARHRRPQFVTPELLASLSALVPIDPTHMPQAIKAMQVVPAAYPTVPQVACFDTAFHERMPAVARMYPLPRRISEAGVVRYGFHGLSCEYIMRELRAVDPTAADGRVIIAHLGNGASLTAVRGESSIDTTMGFTPTGGLMMGTRAGDLDPGVLVYAARSEGMSADALSRLVNEESGLLGVSGVSGDMRDLLAKEWTEPLAHDAIALFCYQAKKFLGALVAVLGGLDTLVFTGGVGEHAAPVRARIGAGLEFLGIAIDPGRNDAHAPIISVAGGSATVRVMKTDEDLMIATHVHRLISPGSARDVRV